MRMTNARITIDALATKIGEILADERPEKFTDADGVDEMKQTIVSVMNKIGWPQDGVPGVRPHIYKMLEDNKIKTLSTFNGMPPNRLQDVETNPANWDLSLDDAKIICKSFLKVDEIENALSCDLYGLTRNGGDYTIQNARGGKLTVKSDSYLKLKQSFNKLLNKGQYTLSDAAMAIELHTKAEAKVTVKNLIKAVKKDELKMYHPITNQRYQYGKGYNLVVRDFEEVTTYSELNNWLDENEPLITWRFPEPQSSDTKYESTDKPVIADDVNNGDDAKSTRSNRLYSEIAEIENYKNIGKHAIRKILAGYIGKDGSCIKSIEGSSINWIDWQGEKQITTNDSFGKWLSRQNRTKSGHETDIKDMKDMIKS